MKGIKQVLFDLGGVLYHIDYTLSIKAFELLGIDDFDEHFSQQQQNGMFDKLETGELNTIDFIDGMMKILPDSNEKEIMVAWNAMLLGLPKKNLEFIHNLSMHMPIYLLSNTNGIHIQHIEKELSQSFGIQSIKSLFTKTYLSHEIGLRKPNKEAFEWVLSDANINAHETLYIDDSIQHINSAKDLGINSMLWEQNKPLRALFLGKALQVRR